jgi:hypothetical protein
MINDKSKIQILIALYERRSELPKHKANFIESVFKFFGERGYITFTQAEYIVRYYKLDLREPK